MKKTWTDSNTHCALNRMSKWLEQTLSELVVRRMENGAGL
jgi:hypothetical protein